MTDHYNTKAKNPPVQRISDGAVSVKVWRNFNQDGLAVYSTTFQRSYTDPKTGEPRESHSLYKDDLLKLPELASEARRTIRHFHKRDRERAAQDRDRDREPSRHPTESRRRHEPDMEPS